MIEVEHLTKNYGLVTAIRDVSFSVAPGQIVGFLGPNGAGKSTAMRILACFMPASSGTARVAGHDVFRESMEVRRRIGYLPESVPLYTDMRVAPYLDFVAEVKGVGRGERKRRVAEVMERCLIADVQGRLMGKRVVGRYFLDHVAAEGVHACAYLLTVDVDMEPLPGYKFASWATGYSTGKHR